MKQLRKIIRKHWRILLPSALMLVIWIFSAMDGGASDAQSVPLADWLGLPNGLLRKVAHFVLFASLGAAWFYYLKRTTERAFTPAGLLAISWTLALLYAGIDEIHQAWVPGRAGLASDVLLDGGAALIGVLLGFLLLKWRDKKRGSISPL